jgi:hypothetical protein
MRALGGWVGLGLELGNVRFTLGLGLGFESGGGPFSVSFETCKITHILHPCFRSIFWNKSCYDIPTIFVFFNYFFNFQISSPLPISSCLGFATFI